VKLSNSGRYMISRDYLSVKVWDLHMETKPIESYPVSTRVYCISGIFAIQM
jgi:serine/threonine-protein phosphatase 2A regulatory subunit B